MAIFRVGGAIAKIAEESFCVLLPCTCLAKISALRPKNQTFNASKCPKYVFWSGSLPPKSEVEIKNFSNAFAMTCWKQWKNEIEIDWNGGDIAKGAKIGKPPPFRKIIYRFLRHFGKRWGSDFQPWFRGTQEFREHLPRVPRLTCRKMTLLANSRQQLSIDFFVRNRVSTRLFCIDLLCWIIFVVSKIFGNLHFRSIL